MAVEFVIKADSERLERKLNNLVNSQMPYATSLAINQTLTSLHRYNRQLMKMAFKNPTPYTMNAFYVKYSNKRNLTGFLRRKDQPARKHYLEVQDSGGQRPQKGMEKNFAQRLPYEGIIQSILPTQNTPLNQYGNINQGFIVRVMSQLQVMSNRDANAPRPGYTKKGNKAKVRYFVPRPDHPLSRRGKPGVYEARDVQGLSFIKKVLHISDSLPMYRKRTNFEENMKIAAGPYMRRYWSTSIKRALSTARLR